MACGGDVKGGIGLHVKSHSFRVVLGTVCSSYEPREWLDQKRSVPLCSHWSRAIQHNMMVFRVCSSADCRLFAASALWLDSC